MGSAKPKFIIISSCEIVRRLLIKQQACQMIRREHSADF
jgi:hypothetical protein